MKFTDKSPGRWSWRNRFSMRAPIVAMLFLLCRLSGLADPPVPKQAPRPDQGTISPSGKFSPAATSAASETPPRTAAEAEAALKQALKISQTASNTFQIGKVEFDKTSRTVSLSARVAVRTQIVEYALVTETGKAYESMFKTAATPKDVHLAFLLLGLGQVELGGAMGQPVRILATNAVRIEVAWETNGQTVIHPLSQLLSLVENGPEAPGHDMAVEKWLYNGSVFDRWGFAAQREGSIIAMIRDPAALINNPGSDLDNDHIHLPKAGLLPPEGWPVRVVIRLPERQVLPPEKLPPWVSPITPLSTNR